MQNILHELTRKDWLIIASIFLALSYVIVIRMLILDWFKTISRKKSERRIWEIKEDPLSEGVTEGEDDELIEENEAKEEQEDDDSVTPEEEESFKKLELLAADIERLLSENQDRQALMESLANTIRTYTELNKPPYRVAINNLIIRRMKQQCLFTITEEEANTLWPPA